MQFPAIREEVHSSSLSSDSDTLPSVQPLSTTVLLEGKSVGTACKETRFRLRNLWTGREVDLRDEAEATFGRSFAVLIDRPDQTVQYSRLL